MSIRVRFAPSPTGQVHIGNIRAAIFNWLFARHEGGQFLLRIEDTDRERSTPEAVWTLLDAMQWLGLTHDEPPMYQSTRLDAHKAAAEELVKRGCAYREDKGGTGKGECIVFRMPPEDVVYEDLVKGSLRKEAKDLKDFVILRSDGTPVFHLANVVDDIEMKISHIIRGDDHVENTFKHIPLYRALGVEPPKYAHLPMIINAQGKPYSKRDGAAFVGEFRDRGFLAEALFNYLTLLGWSPGDDREKLSRDETIRLFTLDRIKSGPAQMDIAKLTHLNSLYLQEMAPEVFTERVRSSLVGQPWAEQADPAYFRRVALLLQSRTTVYPDAVAWKYFFVDVPDFDEKAVAKGLKKEGIRPALLGLKDRLATDLYDTASIEKSIRAVEQANGFGEGKLNFAVRVAVTGSAKGAGLYETMELLGREQVLRRLADAVAQFCPDR